MYIRAAMISVVVVFCVGGSSLQANVDHVIGGPSDAVGEPVYLMAARPKDRRDNRQDDRGRSDDREERRDWYQPLVN